MRVIAKLSGNVFRGRKFGLSGGPLRLAAGSLRPINGWGRVINWSYCRLARLSELPSWVVSATTGRLLGDIGRGRGLRRDRLWDRVRGTSGVCI